MNSHEIDYKIFGDDLQAVEIELDPQETVVADSEPSITQSTLYVCSNLSAISCRTIIK